ncbi:MAG TPA: dolichyl-phosphate beta-D-mannosyltransferase [Bdellovibrionales bacterium]|nr:dolichyl-phosphate beta-D-mannosyltransferase [Pseudobdellovibrionaceae bacterium]HAG91390.1 dolichyl-phosphate beta-D-mannosyltransferase [Bdellovibrionales bacterium]|tara:strand:+ start:1169 stop:1870 length:702 start_codon:yes stop_codon:yes gene_type:complete
MKTLVVVPTYNERENITNFMDRFLAEVPEADLLVVDDSSPDGTFQLVEERSQKDSRVHLLLRTAKEGLGRAYIAGFRWALEKNYDVIVQMDADFSHRFEDLNRMLEEIQNYDVCLGSRWVSGGGTLNWGLSRKIISRGGSFYSRRILGFPIRDWTGGFNAWKAEVLRAIDFESLVSEGYSFQIELKYRALKKGFRLKEVPILFEDRRVGQSKMSSRIMIEALLSVWKFRLWRA